MRTSERRNVRERSLVTRRLIEGLTENPSLTLTADTLQAWLSVPHTAAQRILRNLASSGLVREIQHGVWVPSPLGVQMGSR
jgi:predicted transcriptional regulator